MSANVSPQLFQEICEALMRHHYRLRLQPGDTLTDHMRSNFFDSFCNIRVVLIKSIAIIYSRTCVPGKPNEQVIDWIQANDSVIFLENMTICTNFTRNLNHQTLCVWAFQKAGA